MAIHTRSQATPTRPGKPRWGVALAVVCVLLLGVVFVGGMSQRRHKESQFAAAKVDAQRQIDTAIATGVPVAMTEMPPAVAEFQRASEARMRNLRTDYEAELTAMGLEKLFDPARLAADPGLAQSRAMLAQGLSIVNKYRNRTRQVAAENAAAIDTLEIDPDYRRGLRHGYDQAMAAGLPRALEVWDEEALGMAELGKAIELLGRTQGRWHARNGELLFDSDADLAEYRGYLETAQRINTDGETRRQAYAAERQRIFGNVAKPGPQAPAP